ncbi:Metallothionein expression activator [Collariella sp. IMI 366227]|nr:Metallothionein expression activator [Collariella sp. IMI 366227]
MSGPYSRRGQHRRQNSTPSAFAPYEPVKIAPLPSFQQRPPVSHRRGLSLDTRRQQFAPTVAHPAPRQDYISAGFPTNNPGLPTTTPHILHEAQQQRTTIRPSSALSSYSQHDEDNFLISPQVTPQTRRFANIMPGQEPMVDVSGLQYDAYLGSFDMLKSPNFAAANAIDPSRDFDFFVPDSTLSTPTFLTFPESNPAQGWNSETETAGTQSRRGSRRISNGIMDKVAKFEAMGPGLDGSSRPCTPSNQDAIGSFPQSPVQTPIKLEPAIMQPPSRFAGHYDESMEETLKPVRKRASGIFSEMRQQAEAMVHTPPRANTIPMALTEQALRSPEFMNMRNISAEFKKIELAFGGIPCEPLQGPSSNSSLKPNPFDNKPEFHVHSDYHPDDTIAPLGGQSPARSRRGSPHRRTESIVSITSAASIADINVDEAKTETGVSVEDIAAYIQGPDPTDGKWVCLFENCNKRFGRKENIKSHVQTHLNDRQYQCPTCHKCFVRQHDLKRHAKIHTGIKPYPCECGNSFARHDALTRHRQRGMCIGAFDGIVRKVVKRGRPKKIRGPDMEERRDKADRTRRKNASRPSTANSAASPPSSYSGYSDSSAAPSPSNEFDGLMDDDQFPGILDMSIPSLPSPPPTLP